MRRSLRIAVLSCIDFLKGTFTLITGTALGGRGAVLRILTAPSFVPSPPLHILPGQKHGARVRSLKCEAGRDAIVLGEGVN